MARKPKETKSNNKEIITLKKAIEELDLIEDDVIIVNKNGTSISEDVAYHISEIPDKQLNSQVIHINKNAGGIKYKYNAWKIIIK